MEFFDNIPFNLFFNTEGIIMTIKSMKEETRKITKLIMDDHTTYELDKYKKLIVPYEDIGKTIWFAIFDETNKIIFRVNSKYVRSVYYGETNPEQ